MNDPHVVSLLYKIKPDRSVDYSDAKPYHHEEEAFRVHAEQEQVRFEMKAHYASANEAQEAVRNFICAWEFSASLKYGPKVFKLVFRDYKIEDRKPTPGKVSLRGDLVVPPPNVQGELTVITPRPYPAPPSTFKHVSSNAQSMHDRFIHSRAGKEPLASMAYFCLTVLEASVSQSDQQHKRRRSQKRKQAAEKFRIEPEVLDKIGELSSERGSRNEARKAYRSPTDLVPLTDVERRFLMEVIRRIICRVAETEYDPVQELPEIKLSDVEVAVSPE